MKTRASFVSNSSSSSFIIYKPLLTGKQLQELEKWWAENKDEIRDDDRASFYVNGNYLFVYCNSHSEKFINLLKKVGVKGKDYCHNYS